jgi:hypothetical protein
MRTGLFLLSAVLVLGLSDHGEAQTQATGSFFSTAPPDSFFTGVNPKDVKIVPVDVNAAMKTLNINQAFMPPRQPTPFVLSNFFPKINLPGWPPKTVSAPRLTQSPFQTITTVPLPKKK